jgi:hypothetical protein
MNVRFSCEFEFVKYASEYFFETWIETAPNRTKTKNLALEIQRINNLLKVGEWLGQRIPEVRRDGKRLMLTRR